MSETQVSDEGLGAEERKAAKPRKPYPEDFETFWKAYPDRTNNSKPNAAAAWKRLTAEDRTAALTSLPRFKAFLASKPDLGCVHAERYLKQRRFEGFAEAHQSATDQTWWKDPAKVAMLTPSQWKGSISKHANGIWSVEKLGPAPGHPKCVVPEAIIAELKLTDRYTPAGISRGTH
jgi:hypothetical protein